MLRTCQRAESSSTQRSITSPLRRSLSLGAAAKASLSSTHPSWDEDSVYDNVYNGSVHLYENLDNNTDSRSSRTKRAIESAGAAGNAPLNATRNNNKLQVPFYRTILSNLGKNNQTYTVNEEE